MRSLLSYFVNKNAKTVKSLGIFKDTETSKYKAFDEQGNIEELGGNQFVADPTKVDTVIIDTTYANEEIFETGSFTINSTVGQMIVDLDGYMFNSGSMFSVPLQNSFIKEGSIIFLSLEGDINPNRASFSVGSVTNGSCYINGWFGWNVSLNFKINFLIINPS
jgi:hypothetical protein